MGATPIRRGSDHGWSSIFQRKARTGQTVTGVDARAGFLDRPVLLVLAVSLTLIAAIFGALLISVIA